MAARYQQRLNSKAKGKRKKEKGKKQSAIRGSLFLGEREQVRK
jgi:hypothetical protein